MDINRSNGSMAEFFAPHDGYWGDGISVAKEKILKTCSQVVNYSMQKYFLFIYVVKVPFIYTKCYKNSSTEPKFACFLSFVIRIFLM